MQELLEKYAITQLVYRYANAVDRRDAAAINACFTEGATMSWPGAEIAGNIGETLAMRLTAFDATMHNVHTHLHDIHDDKAAGVTYCTALHLKRDGDKTTKWEWYFRYKDDLVKSGGQWRFVKRHLEVLGTTTGFIDEMPAPANESIR